MNHRATIIYAFVTPVRVQHAISSSTVCAEAKVLTPNPGSFKLLRQGTLLKKLCPGPCLVQVTPRSKVLHDKLIVSQGVKEISRYLCNPRFHCCIDNSRLLAPNLCQISPLHTCPSCIRCISVLLYVFTVHCL